MLLSLMYHVMLQSLTTDVTCHVTSHVTFHVTSTDVTLSPQGAGALALLGVPLDPPRDQTLGLVTALAPHTHHSQILVVTVNLLIVS